MKNIIKLLTFISGVLLISGCSNKNIVNTDDLIKKKSQLEIRAIQTKRFYSTSKDELIKVIVKTIQDEQLLILDINNEVGTVSVTGNINMLMSVSYIKNKTFEVRISPNRD